jgi:hypothetical protein
MLLVPRVTPVFKNVTCIVSVFVFLAASITDIEISSEIGYLISQVLIKKRQPTGVKIDEPTG